MKRHLLIAGAFLIAGLTAQAEIKTTANHNDNDAAKPGFKFKEVPAPSKDDAAAKAQFTLVDGERDEAGAQLAALNDGKVAEEEDQPDASFFFNAGTEGGRLRLDLGSVIAIKQINSYSWHPNSRGPQVYRVYGTDGKAEGFNAFPKKGTDPEKAGWKLIAKVNTKPKGGAEGGGQYGVSIADSEGSIGKYRYLLFDILQTEDDDAFGNTFYTEIDVIEQK